MRVINRITTHVMLLSLSLAAACSGVTARSRALPPEVDALRASLEPYSSLTLAKKAGYGTAITDCMSNGDVGAMGIHLGNPALIDDTLDPLKPEVLVFEPGTNGEMSLVGVEFVIPFALLARSAPAPTLFGQVFSANEVFGLWALHVWTHRANPSGLFAPWNPRVRC